MLRWVAIAICLASAGCTCRGADNVGPEVQVVGDSHKRMRGEASPDASPFFDGERVTLRAVRGETLGLQVLLSELGRREVGLSIEAPGVRVSAYAVGFVRVDEPSTSMYGPSRGAGWYPDRLTPASQPVASDEIAFFDVAVGAGAEPGAHPGELTVGDRRYPVELTVEPVTIELAKDPLVWVWYAPRELARVHGGDRESDEVLAWERRYQALFRAHGAYSSTDLGRVGAESRLPMVDDVTYVPVYVAREGPEAIQRDVRYWIDRFEGTGQVPFSIPIDEPGTDAERRRVRQLAEWAREAGAGPGRFLIGVTDKPRPIYGEAVDLFVSPYGIPASGWGHERGAELWTYNGNPPHAGNMIVDTYGTELRTWGWIAFRYDVPLWFAWEGMYFSDRYNEGRIPDLETDVLTFDDGDDHGNGDGLLAYPGAIPSLRLKALRRGLQDRLLLEKLASCGDTDGASAIASRMMPRALAAGRGRRAWSVDEARWERARRGLIDALVRRCRSLSQ